MGVVLVLALILVTVLVALAVVVFVVKRRRRALHFSVRAESAADAAAISQVHRSAFATEGSDGGDGEARLVEQLRGDGDLFLSLVAVLRDGHVIGHVALSPTTVDFKALGWLQLAPLAVLPEFQRKGVGTALVNAAIAHLRTQAKVANVHGVAVVGSPQFYGRFGFEKVPGFEPEARHELEREHFFALRISDRAAPPQGTLRYARAFRDL